MIIAFLEAHEYFNDGEARLTYVHVFCIALSIMVNSKVVKWPGVNLQCQIGKVVSVQVNSAMVTAVKSGHQLSVSRVASGQ
jgi:hypothetical protein